MINRWNLEAVQIIEEHLDTANGIRLKKLIICLEFILDEKCIKESFLAGDLNMLMLILEELMIKKDNRLLAPHFQKTYLKNMMKKKKKEEQKIEDTADPTIIDG